MDISYGSLMEVLCQLELSLDLGYITETEYKKLEEIILSESRMLNVFKKKIDERISH